MRVCSWKHSSKKLMPLSLLHDAFQRCRSYTEVMRSWFSEGNDLESWMRFSFGGVFGGRLQRV